MSDERVMRAAAAANLRDAAQAISTTLQRFPRTTTPEEIVHYLLDRAEQIEQGGHCAFPAASRV